MKQFDQLALAVAMRDFLPVIGQAPAAIERRAEGHDLLTREQGLEAHLAGADIDGINKVKQGKGVHRIAQDPHTPL